MNIILKIIAVIITSFYFFSFEFLALPSINTKMMLAVVGLAILLIRMSKERSSCLKKNIMILSVYAMIVSVIGFFSVVYNGTLESAYTTYIVSMWVWLASAYAVVSLIKEVHGKVTPLLICNYLIAVCAVQCILSMMIDFVPAVKSVVNANIGSMSGMGGAAEFDKRERLYGIGAAVDVAGTRFAAIEVLIAYICVHVRNLSRLKIILYLMAFWIIAVIGNMVARTTTVGVSMAIIYWIYKSIVDNNESVKMMWRNLGMVSLFFLPLVIILYQINPVVNQHIHFGFEGFFSLWNSGTWEVHSNEVLENMYRFPKTLKTWLIGDGYFENPMSDPYYNGYHWKGFYMGTDVGYLRFIFHFGLIGLLAFILFLVNVYRTCVENSPNIKRLFLLLLVLNFIIWFKVSTDLFLVFALFLCISQNDGDLEEVEEQFI